MSIAITGTNGQGFGSNALGWYPSPERSWWWRVYRWGQENRPLTSAMEKAEVTVPEKKPDPTKKPNNHRGFSPYVRGYGAFRGRRSILMEALTP